jgi:hypothetical protein
MPNPSDTFTWLHLTDLHFGLKGQSHLWPNLRQPFFDDLAKLLEKTGRIDAVLFTGDLVQQGQPKEFAAMQTEVLDRLWQKLAEHGCGDAVLLAVPGNHDLVRPDAKGDNPALDVLLEPGGYQRIQDKFWDQPDGAYRKLIRQAFADYCNWWQGAPRRAEDITHGIIPGDFACTLPCGARKIGIIGLNTAFLQLGGGKYHGKLVWDVRQLHAVCGGAVDDWVNQHDICLLLTHQGPDWLTQEALKHGKREITPAGRFAVHLFGHMHENNLFRISTGGNPAMVRQWQAASLFGMEKYGEPPTELRSHGYAIGQIHFAENQANLRMWPRRVVDDPSEWRFDRDGNCARLHDDDGTIPDAVQARSRAPAPPPPPAATTSVEQPTSAQPSGNFAPAPRQQALAKLEKMLEQALTEEAARPFMLALAADLHLPSAVVGLSQLSAQLPALLAALDALPDLAGQMYAIQRALHAQTMPVVADKEHAIERAAAALYLRAALLAVNLASAAAVCPSSPDLTVLPNSSAALVAVLLGALRGEVQQLNLHSVRDEQGKIRQSAKGKALIDLDDTPFYPLMPDAALAHEVASRVLPGQYHSAAPPQAGAELASLQEKIQSRVKQNQAVFARFFRFIVSNPDSTFFQDDAKVAEVYAKLGIPVTRIVPDDKVDVKQMLGVSLTELDDLFMQFLELLDAAKRPASPANPVNPANPARKSD